ncbi:hypothetical protein [Nocardia fluminea]|uniref:hypothetical protein n=1 Tax=Nocardia fluminea TaxID=134984 RepID=UPI003653CAD1
MNDRDNRIAEYEAQLALVYAPELASLATRFDAVGKVVNTGGGCMAIEATIGTVPGTNQPLQLLVTTADPGLAEERAEILHWLIGLYDGDEGGDPVAEGHDTDSFADAVESALRNLALGVPPPSDLCDCYT